MLHRLVSKGLTISFGNRTIDFFNPPLHFYYLLLILYFLVLITYYLCSMTDRIEFLGIIEVDFETEVKIFSKTFKNSFRSEKDHAINSISVARISRSFKIS